MGVNVRAYLSPTLVLLALDWGSGKTRSDFLGFAIKRSPGFHSPEETRDFGSVVIHHKFVVIDAEGDKPTIYTGSANMSGNSEDNNDENLIELQDGHVPGVYPAEFMRLHEHYRARAIAIKDARKPPDKRRLALRPTRKWADKYFRDASPEAKARIAMASGPSGGA